MKSPKAQKRDRYFFVPLSLAEQFEALAAQRGVSKVARGERASKQTDGGFFQAAKRANGDKKKLSSMPVKKGSAQNWWQRRNNFCARHRAQQADFGEKAIEQTGRYKGTPTRRELGLLMWMCSSMEPQELRKLLPRVESALQ